MNFAKRMRLLMENKYKHYTYQMIFLTFRYYSDYIIPITTNITEKMIKKKPNLNINGEKPRLPCSTWGEGSN